MEPVKGTTMKEDDAPEEPTLRHITLYANAALEQRALPVARALFLKVLEFSKDAEKDKMDIVAAEGGLGHVCRIERQFEESIGHYERAMKLLEIPDDNAQRVHYMRNISECYSKLAMQCVERTLENEHYVSLWEKSMCFLKESQDVVIALYGRQHAEFGEGLSLLASMYELDNDNELAEECVGRALKLLEPGSYNHRRATATLVYCLRKRKDYINAWNTARTISLSLDPEQVPDQVAWLVILSDLAFDMKSIALALKYRHCVLKVHRELGNVGHVAKAQADIDEMQSIAARNLWKQYRMNYRICSNCDKAGEKFPACKKCRITHYCDGACQKQHWPEHKKKCSPKK